MKILNFGSLNLDYVYSVEHIVLPGETISSTGLEVFCGGKGLNQSVALARAGAKVYHAGMVGPDGGPLLKMCEDNCVDVTHIKTIEERSGNAIIQLGRNGQNSIVLFGGANQQNDKTHVDEVLSHFEAGDWILLQNEVNELAYTIERAAEKGMNIALNPSPYNQIIDACDLGAISLFILNEVEGEQMTDETYPEKILSKMRVKFPNAKIVLTLGKNGVYYSDDERLLHHGVYNVEVVDTTAAGDTFTGYFLNEISGSFDPAEALRLASIASSLAVSRKGATSSIPYMREVRSADLVM